MAHVWDTKTPLLEPRTVPDLPHQTSTSDYYVHTPYGAGPLAGRSIHPWEVEPKMRLNFRTLNPSVSHWFDNGKGLGLKPGEPNIYDAPKNSAAAFGSAPFNFDIGEQYCHGQRQNVGVAVKAAP